MAKTNSLLSGGRLLIRPHPEKGESLLGFVHRVGELNGLTPLNWVKSVLSEIGPYGIPEPKFHMLSDALGIAPDELAALTCRPGANSDGRSLLYRRTAIPLALLRMSRSAVCMMCLHEHHATPAHWDLRLICVCARHRRWLIDTCPRCTVPLSWRRKTLVHCDCGYMLAQSDPSLGEPEPADPVIAFTEALEDELTDGLPFGRRATERFPRAFRKHFFSSAVSAFIRTRRYVQRWNDSPGLTLPATTRLHREDIGAVDRLSHVFHDWPKVLHDEIRSQAAALATSHYQVIRESEFYSIVPSPSRISRRIREIAGKETLVGYHKQFCMQHVVQLNGLRMFLSPIITHTNQEGNCMLGPNIVPQVEAFMESLSNIVDARLGKDDSTWSAMFESDVDEEQQRLGLHSASD